ncbi:uncharacterized protein ACB057_015281 [Neosynchiropus ocellatus]
MSVAFNSESSEMKYRGLDLTETDRSQRRSTAAERWMRPAAVCSILVVPLLLLVLLFLVAQNTGSSSTQPASENLKSRWENLTFQWLQLQDKCHALEKEKDAMRAERDALKPERDALRNQTTVCAADKQRLGTEIHVLAAERDGLRAERDALTGERNQLRDANQNMTEELEGLRRRYGNLLKYMDHALNGTDRVCPDDWLKFESSCYYLSARTESKTWLRSKKDCEKRNALLVIIDSERENEFLSRFFPRVWIGLSDTDKEGEWKWVDGTALTGATYWMSGEPNDHRTNEDCVELKQNSKEWNDVPCSLTFPFICEM